jgi:hypothetical protein
MKTQHQFFSESDRKVSEQNRAFMDMVNDPVKPHDKR